MATRPHTVFVGTQEDQQIYLQCTSCVFLNIPLGRYPTVEELHERSREHREDVLAKLYTYSAQSGDAVADIPSPKR